LSITLAITSIHLGSLQVQVFPLAQGTDNSPASAQPDHAIFASSSWDVANESMQLLPQLFQAYLHGSRSIIQTNVKSIQAWTVAHWWLSSSDCPCTASFPYAHLPSIRSVYTANVRWATPAAWSVAMQRA